MKLFFTFAWLLLTGRIAALAGPLPTVDLSRETERQTLIAQGTETVYQGHPTTVLLADGRTVICVWTLGHGGVCGPMRRSEDGGRTWGALVPTPESWTTVKNCPSIYRLTDPKNVTRLFVFAGQGPDGTMQQSYSTDRGLSWTPMAGNGLTTIMPFCTIVPVDGGQRLIGLTNIRRPEETKDKTSNIIAQSESLDGGLTWSPWRIVLDLGELKPCEPDVIRSPDGRQLLCLMRENTRKIGGLFMTSDDEGATWSKPKPLPAGLSGDRHQATYALDGRLVVAFRDTGQESPTRTHFVAWVGRYEDIVSGRDGEYRIKLLHSYAGGDCGYPGLEGLPNGEFLATTYIKIQPGVEKQSVVSTRFTLAEMDARAEKITGPSRFRGVVVDDDQAVFTGGWEVSTKYRAMVGRSYRHDSGGQGQGQGQGTVAQAIFTPKIETPGRYEVRFIYPPSPGRASNVQATIKSLGRERTVAFNEREDCLVDGVPRTAGVFEFAAGSEGSVTISNKGANGHVAIDGVLFVPEAEALAERQTLAGQFALLEPPKAKTESAAIDEEDPENQTPEKRWAAERNRLAAAVAFSPLTSTTVPRFWKDEGREPVALATDTPAEQIAGQSFDLVVIGGTGSGVMCATRAAREGLRVLLVQHNRHLGGMMTNGLMQWDTLYGGPRAPLFTELLDKIEQHYIATTGRNSPDHQMNQFTHQHYPISWVEPHVAEREFNRLVAGEKNITVLLGHYPVAVEREGALLRSVTLREAGGTADIQVKASTFADATYEGDFLALAGVPYRVGREGRSEFNEPHAGKFFTNVEHGNAPQEAVEARLNLHPFGAHQGVSDPENTGEADAAVQAYNFRFCVTRAPSNRLMLTEPPPGYDRERYVNFDRKYISSGIGPNEKSPANGPVLPGANHEYPEGDWATREKIAAQHRNFALGLMWFLQNDESIEDDARERFREWGLPKDEYPDNGHVPYEMYVREARRLSGRYICTEHDYLLAPGLGRPPLFSDSIATTDWFMDSHSCLDEQRPGYRYEGKLLLTEETRPGQIPYRALLPLGVDNLLVPVCLSATHVAWGAIRLEPVWMQIGEAAGFAAALAHRQKTTPAQLSPDLLVRTLADRRQLVTFFNDLRVDAPEPWISAVQYFGTKGFFPNYNAKLDEPLTRSVAKQWVRIFSALRAGSFDANAAARALTAETVEESPAISIEEFRKLLTTAKTPAPLIDRIVKTLKSPRPGQPSRGAVCQALYLALTP